jgi:hypothetical protein
MRRKILTLGYSDCDLLRKKRLEHTQCLKTYRLMCALNNSYLKQVKFGQEIQLKTKGEKLAP